MTRRDDPGMWNVTQLETGRLVIWGFMPLSFLCQDYFIFYLFSISREQIFWPGLLKHCTHTYTHTHASANVCKLKDMFLVCVYMTHRLVVWLYFLFIFGVPIVLSAFVSNWVAWLKFYNLFWWQGRCVCSLDDWLTYCFKSISAVCSSCACVFSEVILSLPIHQTHPYWKLSTAHRSKCVNECRLLKTPPGCISDFGVVSSPPYEPDKRTLTGGGSMSTPRPPRCSIFSPMHLREYPG